jgi:hypothetical protein
VCIFETAEGSIPFLILLFCFEPGEKGTERSAEGVMPAPSTIFEDSSAEAKMAAVGEDSTPPGTPDGREAGAGE